MLHPAAVTPLPTLASTRAAWSDGALSGVFRHLFVEQWQAIDAQPRIRDPQAQLKLLGLYGVAMLALIGNEYAVDAIIEALPKSFRGGRRSLTSFMVWGWLTAGFYIVPAVLYSRFVLGMGLADLGLRLRGLRDHIGLYVAMLAAISPVVLMASTTEHFQKVYPFYRKAGDSWGDFLGWETAYAAQFLGLELFFRGFLLMFPARVLGAWAIPAMVMPYMMIHFAKPLPECVGSIIAGLVLGIVALRTRSVWAGMAVHVAVAWSMDLLSLGQRGKLGALFGG